MIEQEMNRLLERAKTDEDLKSRLLETQYENDPVQSFCNICAQLGHDITVGGLFAYGMAMNDSKLRATNGGGSFEIEGWDDLYENFLDELRR